MPSLRKKIGWWLDSVQGLRSHVIIYKRMREAVQVSFPDGAVSPEAATQLRSQERMVGRSLLHVLLVHKVGSGRFWD